MKILQLVSVMLLRARHGSVLGSWFSLSRSMDAITAATFLEIGKIMISNLGRPMSILLPASISLRCQSYTCSIVAANRRGSFSSPSPCRSCWRR